MRIALALSACWIFGAQLPAQQLPRDPRIERIVREISTGRIEQDLGTLVRFGTRHTLSDTMSSTRGIGAARRWIKAEFDRIATACGGCMAVRFQAEMARRDTSRIGRDVMIVNVLATLRGTVHPERVVLMTAHLDSRASDPNDATTDAPGAADDASGVAAVLEAARVLSAHGPYEKTIVLAALSGEEQGLFGGAQLARLARDSGWTVEAVLNNDIIGNARGITGERNTREFRVFSEAAPSTETADQRRAMVRAGGEVDGPSRQVARYVDRITERYGRGGDAVLVYRQDRFGRGGDHRAFNALGFPAVRFTVMNENYNRQHQNVRSENGVEYGDVVEEISFPYIARVTTSNAATLAALAWAPPPPDSVTIRGAVTPNTTVRWAPVSSPGLAGYRVYWRETTESAWRYSRDVGNVTTIELKGINIDNYLFGVAAVGRAGDESVVVFAR
jgi:Zn-dependent M28 family amino/carboxypeptidase